MLVIWGGYGSVVTRCGDKVLDTSVDSVCSVVVGWCSVMTVVALLPGGEWCLLPTTNVSYPLAKHMRDTL